MDSRLLLGSSPTSLDQFPSLVLGRLAATMGDYTCTVAPLYEEDSKLASPAPIKLSCLRRCCAGTHRA